MLKIRRISQREKQLKAWQQQYHVDQVVDLLSQEQRYFNVFLRSETQQVNVLIQAENWCKYRWPDLAHYAWEALDTKSLCEIFMFENSTERFFTNQFHCKRVDIADNNKAQQFRLLVQEPNLGAVLLSAPIEGLQVRELTNNVFESLPLSIDWILGYSQISLSLLRSLALGDVLYIQQLQLHLSVAGRLVAQFQKQEEGLFMIEEMLSPEMEGANIQPSEGYQDEIIRPFNLADMSIKLTFVLGHSDIPVNEIGHIQPGSIFSIGENKEREVKVYANKQLVAEGELIYIGDTEELGLEITRIISLGDKRV